MPARATRVYLSTHDYAKINCINNTKHSCPTACASNPVRQPLSLSLQQTPAKSLGPVNQGNPNRCGNPWCQPCLNTLRKTPAQLVPINKTARHMGSAHGSNKPWRMLTPKNKGSMDTKKGHRNFPSVLSFHQELDRSVESTCFHLPGLKTHFGVPLFLTRPTA